MIDKADLTQYDLTLLYHLTHNLLPNTVIHNPVKTIILSSDLRVENFMITAVCNWGC